MGAQAEALFSRTCFAYIFSQAKKGCDKLKNACDLAGVKIIEDFHHFTLVTPLIVVTAQISFIKKSKEYLIKCLRFKFDLYMFSIVPVSG